MPHGDTPKQVFNDGTYHNRIPGLRNTAPNSDVEVYKMIQGKKVLVRIESER
jgi:hypothetical protein